MDVVWHEPTLSRTKAVDPWETGKAFFPTSGSEWWQSLPLVWVCMPTACTNMSVINDWQCVQKLTSEASSSWGCSPTDTSYQAWPIPSPCAIHKKTCWSSELLHSWCHSTRVCMATHLSFSVRVPVSLFFPHSFDNLSQVSVTQTVCIAVKELFTEPQATQSQEEMLQEQACPTFPCCDVMSPTKFDAQTQSLSYPSSKFHRSFKNVLSGFMILCQTALTAILGHR